MNLKVYRHIIESMYHSTSVPLYLHDLVLINVCLDVESKWQYFKVGQRSIQVTPHHRLVERAGVAFSGGARGRVPPADAHYQPPQW